MNKILICTTYFYPHIGGLENYVLSTSQELITQGIKVDVMTFNLDKSPTFENYKGMNIYRIPCYNLLSGVYALPKLNKTTKNIFKILKQEKYSAINTQTRFFTSTILGLFFSWQQKIHLIHTEHGNSYVSHPNKMIKTLAWLYDQTLGRIIFHASTKVICISKAGCEFVKKMGAKEEKIIYLPNSINIKEYPPANKQNKEKIEKETKKELKEKLGISKESITLAYIGRIIQAKGIQDLIEAIKGIDNVTLLIVGEGPYINQLKEKSKTLLSNIKFLGKKEKEEIKKILSITDIFINPSYSEGLPTSILEAGCFKLPVIATNVGGTSEIIINNETGMLVPPKNPLEIKNKLITLINSKKTREKLGYNLFKKIEKEYDLKTNVNILKQVLIAK